MKLAEFGRQLLLERDLDPVYEAAMLVQPHLLRRWLLAYWCSYNAGYSAWVAESKGDHVYWSRMMAWAANETEAPIGGRWSRGRERRHFRGIKARQAVMILWDLYRNPDKACRSLESLATPENPVVPYESVRRAVVAWPLFGPWIAFKVGDMMERTGLMKVDFDQSDVSFFDSPRDAANLWDRVESPGDDGTEITRACAHLKRKLSAYLAPPMNDRPLGMQEFETILCKWGSHFNGNYPVGIDRQELIHSLKPWAEVSANAHEMLDHLLGG